jgi:hypothetical protein
VAILLLMHIQERQFAGPASSLARWYFQILLSSVLGTSVGNSGRSACFVNRTLT